MKKQFIFFIILPSLMLLLTNCKKSNDPAPTTGTLSGSITKINSTQALSGTKIIIFDANTNAPIGATVTTDANGNYSVALNPGSYYVKVIQQGYEGIPAMGISAVPFTIMAGQTTTNDYQMNPSAIANGGYISGKITAAGSPIGGVLVVASNGTTGYSSVTDKEGNYSIYNVPANTYSVQGWIAGYNCAPMSAPVSAGAERANVNLTLTSGATGSVTGSVTFLATGNIEVDVALTHPYTHETIPGLNAMTVNGSYSISQVPTGTLLARATYRNDEKVVDPDWILKNGEPTVVVTTGSIQRNFSVTGALLVSSPTNASSTTQPVNVTSVTPTFAWNAYSSTDDYVIEVTNSNGKVIWGGFSGTGASLTKNISIPKAQTSIVYNADGMASESLQPGRVYRWKVYASKNDNTGTPAWKLISASEDQRGLISIAPTL